KTPPPIPSSTSPSGQAAAQPSPCRNVSDRLFSTRPVQRGCRGTVPGIVILTKEKKMTRLPLIALFLAGSGAALPAQAQEAAEGPNEKVNQVIVYGNDKCEPSSPDEIVVCKRLPEADRYRVPQIFRGGDPRDPRNQAWLNRVVAMERVGR